MTAILAVGGCGDDGTVRVPSPELDAATAAACVGFLDALPDLVDDTERRMTSSPGSSAAWGSPAVVLRCGVDQLPEFNQFSTCQQVNGVGWFVPESSIEDQHADIVMTTVGRRPLIEVRIPASRRPPAAVMVDLGPAVLAHTDKLAECS